MALESIRSLLCTATGETPHSRFMKFPRRSHHGGSLPDWLCEPGTVLLRKFNRTGKNDDVAQKVQLMEANPLYARVKFSDGRESMVSVRDIARYPREEDDTITNDDVIPDDEDVPVSGDFENDDMGEEVQDDLGHHSEETAEPVVMGDAQGDSKQPDASSNGSVKERRRMSMRYNKGVPPLRYGQSSGYD